jgi:hypothetical protein
VAKIDPEQLPKAPNLEYPGQVAYADLPSVMAGFDVALMPFALNEATRAISPTKTLEYLAADYRWYRLGCRTSWRTTAGWCTWPTMRTSSQPAAGRVVTTLAAEREHRIRHIKKRQEWDYIAASMHGLIRPETAGAGPGYRGEVSA